jgi:hypothetical protein
VRQAGLQLVAAKAVLDLATPQDLADAATAALEDDLDSPSLRLLAGLTSDDLDEARALLDRALVELSLRKPNQRDAVLDLAHEFAAEVVEETLAPYQGAKRIWELTLRVPEEHLPELDSFVYAASEWEDRPEDRARFDEGIVTAARALLDA